MSEIEKMYENAEIKPICNWWCRRFDETSIADCNGIYDSKKECSKCEHGYVESEKYPPFTAEKQLKLIKFLLKNYEGVDISKKINRFNFLVDNATFIGCHHNDKSFEEGLTGVINKLWADMPEEEKQQVKGILE